MENRKLVKLKRIKAELKNDNEAMNANDGEEGKSNVENADDEV